MPSFTIITVVSIFVFFSFLTIFPMQDNSEKEKACLKKWKSTFGLVHKGSSWLAIIWLKNDREKHEVSLSELISEREKY